MRLPSPPLLFLNARQHEPNGESPLYTPPGAQESRETPVRSSSELENLDSFATPRNSSTLSDGEDDTELSPVHVDNDEEDDFDSKSPPLSYHLLEEYSRILIPERGAEPTLYHFNDAVDPIRIHR